MSWTDDGSGKLTITGNQIVCTGKHEKANGIWSTAGSGCWEFKVSGKSGTWLGLCSKDKFGAGYGMKGLFYGGPGNLSDGNSLVTGHWGPKFGDGDVIRMRAEHKDKTTVVSFSKNGAGLGTAFKLEGWKDGESLCPAVSMDSEGQGVTITQVDMPELSSMEASTTISAGVEGSWEGRFKLDVSKSGDNAWRVSAHVANNMSCLVEQGADGKLKSGPVISTKMMPPPHLQELEREVSGILGSLSSWRRDGDHLILVHGAGEEKLAPAKGPGPATKDNINWIK